MISMQQQPAVVDDQTLRIIRQFWPPPVADRLLYEGQILVPLKEEPCGHIGLASGCTGLCATTT